MLKVTLRPYNEGLNNTPLGSAENEGCVGRGSAGVKTNGDELQPGGGEGAAEIWGAGEPGAVCTYGNV